MFEHCSTIPGSITPKLNGRALADQDKSAFKGAHRKKKLTNQEEMYTQWVTASLKQEAATQSRPTDSAAAKCVLCTHTHAHAHTLSTSGLTINVKHH